MFSTVFSSKLSGLNLSHLKESLDKGSRVFMKHLGSFDMCAPCADVVAPITAAIFMYVHLPERCTASFIFLVPCNNMPFVTLTACKGIACKRVGWQQDKISGRRVSTENTSNPMTRACRVRVALLVVAAYNSAAIAQQRGLKMRAYASRSLSRTTVVIDNGPRRDNHL